MAAHDARDANDAALTQKISSLIVRFRTPIIAVLAAGLVAVAGLVVASLVLTSRREAAFERIERAVSDLEKARAADDKAALPAKEDEILAEMRDVAARNPRSFAAARALMTVADILHSRKDWKAAEEAYRAASAAAPKAYTAALCEFNAAVCADEQGNADAAVELFAKAADRADFPLRPMALFNLGRVEEQRSNKEAAIAAYQRLADTFPDDEWTKLAKSRLVSLKL